MGRGKNYTEEEDKAIKRITDEALKANPDMAYVDIAKYIFSAKLVDESHSVSGISQRISSLLPLKAEDPDDSSNDDNDEECCQEQSGKHDWFAETLRDHYKAKYEGLLNATLFSAGVWAPNAKHPNPKSPKYDFNAINTWLKKNEPESYALWQILHCKEI